MHVMSVSFRPKAAVSEIQAEINLIRNSALFSMPTGTGRFKKQIEKAMSRKLGYAKGEGHIR